MLIGLTEHVIRYSFICNYRPCMYFFHLKFPTYLLSWAIMQCHPQWSIAANWTAVSPHADSSLFTEFPVCNVFNIFTLVFGVMILVFYWNSFQSGYNAVLLISYFNLIHPVQLLCINPQRYEVVVVTKDQQTRWRLLPFHSQIWHTSEVLCGAWPIFRDVDVPPIMDRYSHVLICHDEQGVIKINWLHT